MPVKEFAERISVSTRTAYRLVATGQIDVVNVATTGAPRLRVTESALSRYLAKHVIKGRAA